MEIINKVLNHLIFTTSTSSIIMLSSASIKDTVKGWFPFNILFFATWRRLLKCFLNLEPPILEYYWHRCFKQILGTMTWFATFLPTTPLIIHWKGPFLSITSWYLISLLWWIEYWPNLSNCRIWTKELLSSWFN